MNAPHRVCGASVGGLTQGQSNTILAKGSNPEMNVSKGLNHSRMGETHQSKEVVCREITLRHMEHVVVVKKIPGSGS